MNKTKELTKNQRKRELLAKANKHQESLYNDLNSASERAVVFGKNMLVLGGVLYVGYTVLDKYLDAKLARTKKVDPGRFEALNKIILPVLAFALQQGSLTLIKKARLMLVKYLEKQADAKEQ